MNIARLHYQVMRTSRSSRRLVTVALALLSLVGACSKQQEQRGRHPRHHGRRGVSLGFGGGVAGYHDVVARPA